MRNVLRKSYGIGGALLTPMPMAGFHQMGTDGRIYYAGASSGNEVVPPGVKLFRMATSEELTRWRATNGAKGQPASPFDVRAEVQAYEQQLAVSNAGPKPNMGSMADLPAPVAATGGFLAAVAIVSIALWIAVSGAK